MHVKPAGPSGGSLIKNLVWPGDTYLGVLMMQFCQAGQSLSQYLHIYTAR